jgi:hypothetical protein
MYTENDLLVVLSKTQLPLWKNIIPDKIYNMIMEKSEIHTRKEVEQLSRHNCILVNTFCSVYGECLERCEFATIRGLPFLFKYFYSVIQIPLYGNCMNPESMEIKVDEVLSFYRKTEGYREVETFIKQNTNNCHSCITFRGYIC